MVVTHSSVDQSSDIHMFNANPLHRSEMPDLFESFRSRPKNGLRVHVRPDEGNMQTAN